MAFMAHLMPRLQKLEIARGPRQALLLHAEAEDTV